MKTVKPLKLGLLHRTYLHEGRHVFAVTAFVFFALRERRLCSEASMWKALAEELGEGEPLDEGMPKARSDVLVTSNAYPRGGAAIGCRPRLRFGSVDKSLMVIGDRHWKADGTASDPEPFEVMSIRWERAYGGEGFERNPVGRGHAPVEEDGERVHRLPNVEHPKKLVRSPSDKPDPAGFGPIDLTRPERMQKAGTYDQKWLETRFPGYAADIDWTFFNQAPADQQIGGFLRGDEEVSFEHMHPSEQVLEGRLPGVAVRCFVNRSADGLSLEEITTRIDTVRFLPHLERGIVVYRGIMDVREDDAGDVVHLLAGLEEMGQPKPAAHYERTLEGRLDKEKGALLALSDGDLVPEGWAPPEPEQQSEELSEHAELTASEGLLQQNAQRRAEREIAQMRERMIEAGLEPPEVETPAAPEPPPTADELPAYVEAQLRLAEEERERAEKEKERMVEEARAICESRGIDYDELVEEKRRESAGPPTFSAEEELDRLKELVQLHRNIGAPHEQAEAQLADPELEDKLRNAEAKLREAYRTRAHDQPAAMPVTGEAGATLRRSALAAVSAGEPLAERDFTGVDLSGADLRQAVAARAWLEAADLSGADLRGLDLSGAVLARAKLREAKLEGADLSGANLAEADLTGAELRAANLSGAVLVRAQLVDTDCDRADFSDADFLEAQLVRTRLDGATLKKAMLLQLELEAVSAVDADFEEAHFIETNVVEADFTRAGLERATFITSKGRGASFREARLAGARLVHESDFEGASFFGADLTGANLRGTNLSGADFRQTRLGGSDLSECDLSGAQLDLAGAVETLFVRTNLSGASATNLNAMSGILQKANLEGADLRGANLFRADLAHIRGNKGTQLGGANTKLIRFVDRPKDVEAE